MSAFIIAARAQRDLEAIDEYLSDRSEDSSERVIRELYAAFRLLSQQPGLGRRRPEWTGNALRFWSVPAYPNYVIIYEDGVTPVRIARVLHGAMNVPIYL